MKTTLQVREKRKQDRRYHSKEFAEWILITKPVEDKVSELYRYFIKLKWFYLHKIRLHK